MGKKTGLYEYSSVQVTLPQLMSSRIFDWGKEMIKDEELYDPPNDLIHGREDEIHVTVLYGIHSSLPDNTEMILSGVAPFEVKLGQISLFTHNDSFDVVKIEVSSPSLFYLNSLLKNNLTNTQIYGSYKPHVTVAYVKKDTFKLKNIDQFQGCRWTVNSIIFSSTNGIKTPLRLNTLRPVRSC